MYQKHSLPVRAGIAFALLFLANASARADLLQWGYNWEPSTMKVNANAGGSGYLALTDEPANSAKGSSNTVVTNIRTFSTAGYNTPDVFHHIPISFTLQLKDLATNATGSVKFSGFFSGTITGHSANIQLLMPPTTSEAVTLGGNKYTVALGTYTPPGPPGASNAGSLNAFVTVAPATGNPGGGGIAGSAPEPGTLTLAGLAFPFLGLTGWRLRRSKKSA